MAAPRDALTDAESPAGLTKAEAQIAYLTIYGLPRPKTLEEAAREVGYRLKRARNYLDCLPAFNLYRRQLLDGRRRSEQGRNLATLIEIRDDPGEGFAADRTVRIKAISAIEGTDKAGGVTINVNQQTNIAAITPGYVIRLPAGAPLPPAERMTIEHQAEPVTIDAAE